MSRFFQIAALAVALAAGAASATTLRIGMQDDPDTLDPAQSTAYITQMVMMSMCDRLVDLNEKGAYVPVLATGWQLSPDARSLTLKLREDATFQNGEPFDADAVVWNTARYKDIKRSRHVAEGKPISRLVVVDPHTLRIEMEKPYAPMLAVLSNWYGMMLAPKAGDAAGKDIGAHPVCVGPYAFEREVAQDRIVLRRAASYWDPKAQGVDEIQYLTIPDATIRLTNLRAHQLDIVERPAPTDLPAVRADPHLRLQRTPSFGFRLMTFNLNHGPMSNNPFGKDPRVREAFELSIDRATINQVVFNGENTPDNQTEAPGSPFYDPDVPVPHRDVAHARALLAEAGTPHPTITIMVPNNPTDAQLGEVMQSMAADAGFDVKVQMQEPIALYSAADRGDFQMIYNMWSGRPDPDQNLSIWLACDGFLNRGQYCNPELDKTLAAATATADQAERIKLYRRVVEIYHRDRPFLFLYNYTWFWATSDKVQGFVPYPDGLIRTKGISLAN
jgi:peptide/nickel transport system substrate-binding protein